MLARSARAARNAAALGEFDEVWPVYVSSRDDDQQRQTASNVFSTATFGIFIVIALLVGSMGLSGPNSSSNPKMAASGPMEDIRKMIRNHAAVRLNDDFHSGLTAWQSVSGKVGSTNDWSFNHGFVQPGRLRLWTDSAKMTDYQLEFVGQIERKGLGWAFRAEDAHNFYASKLSVTRMSPVPATDLIRYAVVDGRESAHVNVPVPYTVRATSDLIYRVSVSVTGDTFSTRINGQMVDSWSDARLPKGGVGFFADAGEVASLRWVTVSHRDNLVGRILSYLGFIAPIQPLTYYAYVPAVVE